MISYGPTTVGENITRLSLPDLFDSYKDKQDRNSRSRYPECLVSRDKEYSIDLERIWWLQVARLT